MKVYLLPRSDVHRIAPLFDGIGSDVAFICSIIEGTRPARIFVDDPVKPQAVLVCAPNGHYMIGGNPQTPALRQFIADTPRESGVFSRDAFAYFVANLAWETALREDTPALRPFLPTRTFRITPDMSFRHDDTADDGIQVFGTFRDMLTHIDQGSLKLGDGIHYSDLAASIELTFGFCALDSNTVASLAWAYALSREHVSLFIDTAEGYRRRGLATRACAAFIDYARSKQLTVGWNALAENTASVRLAQKLGFEETQPQAESHWQPYGPDFQPTEGVWRRLDGDIWIKNPQTAS